MKRPDAAPLLKKPAAALADKECKEDETKGKQKDSLQEAKDEEEVLEEEPKEKDPTVECPEEDDEEEPKEKGQENFGGAQCFDGVWFPAKWRIDCRARATGSQAGAAYRHYNSPTGKVYRSMKAAKVALEEIE